MLPALALAISLGMGGAAWQGIPTEHLFVIVPDGFENPTAVATTLEQLFAEVWAFWFPQGSIPLPLFDLLKDMPEALEALGIPGYQPVEAPQFNVVIYDDPEKLGEESRRFGLTGFYMAWCYDPREFCWELSHRFSEAGMPSDWRVLGAVIGCCPGGDCPALFSHEFTHAVQQYAQFAVPDTLLKEPRLLIEGMARWTEFALDQGGDFDLLVRGPVSIWLELGGTLEEVPEFLVYEIGASLFEYLSFTLSPPEILALFSSPVRELLGLPEEGFSELFGNLYGADWETFLAGWRDWIRAIEPSPQAELVYEAQRLGISFREAFLLPLLTEEEREEIDGARRAIMEGRGTDRELFRADAILREAWAEPSEQVLSAVELRMPSLKNWARAISGPEASARVITISLLKYTEPDHPDLYLRAFVDAVNGYLVSPVPSPRSLRVP